MTDPVDPAAVAADPADPADTIRRIALELAAMAQTGATYATGRYDVKRYDRLREIAAELHAGLVGAESTDLLSQLAVDGGYATPHLDVRGVLVEDGRILLVREASDGRWTLPGGWADVLDTPRSAIEREFAEEAGLTVRAPRVAFVHDGSVSNGHLRAGPPFHIWKLFFICERVDDAAPQAGLDGETTDVGFFALDELPELSTQRVTVRQLELAVRCAADPTLPATTD